MKMQRNGWAVAAGVLLLGTVGGFELLRAAVARGALRPLGFSVAFLGLLATAFVTRAVWIAWLTGARIKSTSVHQPRPS